MPLQVVNGATLKCSFGTTPSSLVVEPIHRTNGVNQPAANIMDHVPMENIMPFGLCITLTNPQVATATSAAMGVLTPQPCLPIVEAPWTPGAPKTNIQGQPALNMPCTCVCEWGGVISITMPGEITIDVT